MKRTHKLLAALLAIVTLATAAAIPAHAAVSDVKPGNWAYNAVQYNVENKLIAIDYSKYNMNAPAPRQDVAYAMYKLTNGKDVEPTKSVYTQYIPQDMKNSPDKYKYSVQWAVQNQIIAGTKNNGEKWTSANYKLWFSPTAIVTREQMATLLYRLAEHDGLETDNYSTVLLNTYSDGWSASKWAQDAIAWCVMNRLMAGTGNNKLSPKTTLTYGQLAQFMKNYGELKASQKPVETPDPTPDVEPTPTPNVTGNSGSYYNQVAHPENAGPTKTDWIETYTFTDLSGPWDNCKAITKLPNGGYMKNGHRYNKYDVCIDTVDGLPTDDEKKAIILTNQYRINLGLEPLEWSQAAQLVAETRAIESQKCHTDPDSKWTHTRPNGDDISSVTHEWNKPEIFAKQAFSHLCAENAFANCPEYYENDYGYHEGYGPKQIIKGWIDSKGHEAALRTTAHYGAIAASHLDTDINNAGEKTYYWYYDAFDIY